MLGDIRTQLQNVGFDPDDTQLALPNPVGKEADCHFALIAQVAGSKTLPAEVVS